MAVQVTTKGRKEIGKIAGQGVFYDAARRDTIEVTGGSNARTICQLIAGYATGDKSDQAAKKIVEALHDALETVTKNVGKIKGALAQNLDEIKATAKNVELEVKEQLKGFKGNFEEELKRRLEHRRAIDAKYGQLRLDIENHEAALKNLDRIEQRLASNIERLAKAEQPVISQVGRALEALTKAAKAEGKIELKFRGPVAVAAGVLVAVGAGAVITNELLDKLSEKPLVPVLTKKKIEW